jgi:hypothetical protein
VQVPEAEDLQKAVERMHRCKARLLATEPVTAFFGAEVLWSGLVHHFLLEGHIKADLAFAWSALVRGRAEFFAVLRDTGIRSAQDAVRAAIVQESRRGDG